MLNKNQIKKLIEDKDLIEDYFSNDIQLSDNGFYITAGEVFKLDKKGKIDFSNSERKIPSGGKISPKKESSEDDYGWWNLSYGAYKIKTNEKIKLSEKLVGKVFSRNCFAKMGASISPIVLNTGFKGQIEVLLMVSKQGIKLKQNARVAHLIFEEVK